MYQCIKTLWWSILWHRYIFIGILLLSSRILTYDIEQYIFELSQKYQNIVQIRMQLLIQCLNQISFYRMFSFNNSNLLFLITLSTILDQIYYTFILITLYSISFCFAVVSYFWK